MATTTTHALTAFLAELRNRHSERLPQDKPYEAMMYSAALPPTRAALAALAGYIDAERPDSDHVPPIPDDPDTLRALGDIVGTMQWPDPAPLAKAARLLPGWDTLHVSTFLHSIIPDYPILGPREVQGLQRLELDADYVAEPQEALPAYGHYMDTIKRLRDAARFDQVPESHHYLTRIVQAALEDLADA